MIDVTDTKHTPAKKTDHFDITENFSRLSRVDERYRQTDRQTTDGTAIAYSERKRQFTFAKIKRATILILWDDSQTFFPYQSKLYHSQNFILKSTLYPSSFYFRDLLRERKAPSIFNLSSQCYRLPERSKIFDVMYSTINFQVPRMCSVKLHSAQFNTCYHSNDNVSVIIVCNN